MSEIIDTSLCPLCSKPNFCMADAKEACWCIEQTFDDSLLKKVPISLKHKSCICQSCAVKHEAIDKQVTNLS